MENQTASVTWHDNGVPVSTRFDDPYFSLQDGAAETRHVFLGGNDLPKRFRPGFHIAELGFGTGLNALVAAETWQQAEMAGPLHFTSFEAFPLSAADMVRAHAALPDFGETGAAFLEHWSPDGGRFDLPGLTLEVIIGDVADTLADWEGKADAWFLDGFAPARNPAMWAEPILTGVARRTAPGGTAATYTAAGFVRRGLAEAGFEVERTAGYAHKRHMTRARMPG